MGKSFFFFDPNPPPPVPKNMGLKKRVNTVEIDLAAAMGRGGTRNLSRLSTFGRLYLDIQEGYFKALYKKNK